MISAFSSAVIFQFTPLREGRPFPPAQAVRMLYFNSRPSARGDVKQMAIGFEAYISIHAPPRGATRAAMPSPVHAKDFNSRPSARGDEAEKVKLSPKQEFQFTPLREGRRDDGITLHSKAIISIHAPPRGATRQNRF